MAKFVICGGQKLTGGIKVLGAKNAAIIMIAAACLIDGKIILENVPDILDIRKIINILEKLGVRFRRQNHRLTIDTRNLVAGNPDPLLVGEIRASIVLVGPFLARFGRIKIPHPGGCTIGARPIDLHLRAFKKLGCEISEQNASYEFCYQNKKRLPDATVRFPQISVTATENVLLFAAAQNRKITIENAAIEPEVIDLIKFLRKAGAKIELLGRTLKIRGQKTLRPLAHRVIPDRIEAGTFAIMAATTRSALKITNICSKHLKSLLAKFQEMGIEFEKGRDFLYIKGSQKIKPVDITSAEYPGFATDLQPPMGVLLTQAEGVSQIRENIFEHRLAYLRELQKMGAKIEILSNRQAKIIGPTPLRGTKIESLDLRAGATILIAGLAASGITEINHAENIDRGYEKIEERLQKIGAKIKRVSNVIKTTRD